MAVRSQKKNVPGSFTGLIKKPYRNCEKLLSQKGGTTTPQIDMSSTTADSILRQTATVVMAIFTSLAGRKVSRHSKTDENRERFLSEFCAHGTVTAQKQINLQGYKCTNRLLKIFLNITGMQLWEQFCRETIPDFEPVESEYLHEKFDCSRIGSCCFIRLDRRSF